MSSYDRNLIIHLLKVKKKIVNRINLKRLKKNIHKFDERRFSLKKLQGKRHLEE